MRSRPDAATNRPPIPPGVPSGRAAGRVRPTRSPTPPAGSARAVRPAQRRGVKRIWLAADASRRRWCRRDCVGERRQRPTARCAQTPPGERRAAPHRDASVWDAGKRWKFSSSPSLPHPKAAHQTVAPLPLTDVCHLFLLSISQISAVRPLNADSRSLTPAESLNHRPPRLSTRSVQGRELTPFIESWKQNPSHNLGGLTMNKNTRGLRNFCCRRIVMGPLFFFSPGLFSARANRTATGAY